MNLVSCDMGDGAFIYLIDQAFEQPVHRQLKKLCADFSPDHPQWIQPTWTNGRPRWEFHFEETQRNNIITAVSQSRLAEALREKCGKNLSVSGMNLWVDFAGFGLIGPHIEQESTALSQIFLSDVQNDTAGTTIYQLNGDLLFTLCYRDNYGWFFNRGDMVKHGREDVPENLARFSILLWWG